MQAVKRWRDEARRYTYFQYADNPEALMVLPDEELDQMQIDTDRNELQEQIEAWLEACERYERGKGERTA